MTDDENDDLEKPWLEGNDFAKGNAGGRGGPPGNSFAKGNPGGGAPANNQNSAKHHLHADPDNVLQYLEDDDPEAFEWVKGKYDSYLEDAPFQHGSAKADKLLETVVCEYSIWCARGIQIREGLTSTQNRKGADGEFYEVEDERPENQAVNRLDRQVLSKLQKLGVFDEQSDKTANGPLSNEYYTVVDVSDDDSDDEGDGSRIIRD